MFWRGSKRSTDEGVFAVMKAAGVNRDMMKVTVILCTYNRCQSLAKALESVVLSTLPKTTPWEILVVDNNSHDQTRNVVEDFCRRYPTNVRYLFEPRQGKSYALNTGVRGASGNVLAFMDDDVTVEPTWLGKLTEPLLHGDWAGSGGRILPEQSFSPPPWLPAEGPYSMAGMLALFDLGDEARELDRAPFGTNMAFRKIAFEEYGGFRTDMGPCPGSEIRNEDTEFGRRLMAAGERLRYEPSAIVYHAVPDNRLTKKYFLAFWFDHGRALVREAGRRADILGIPRHYLTMVKVLMVLAPVRTLRWMVAFNRQWRFYRKGWVWMTAGEIVEMYRLWFAGERQRQSESEKSRMQFPDAIPPN
jgi:glycosyltransferase involved in cell wall biosynthesis